MQSTVVVSVVICYSHPDSAELVMKSQLLITQERCKPLSTETHEGVQWGSETKSKYLGCSLEYKEHVCFKNYRINFFSNQEIQCEVGLK